MPFQKGTSGNPAGRPAGTPNKTTTELREKINLLVNEQFEQIKTDLESLEPRERVKLYIDLLQYALPKLSTTRAEIEDVTPVEPFQIIAESEEAAEDIREMIELFKGKDTEEGKS